MSALARMAKADHKAIEIKPGDQIILSSTPIPGNEKLVSNVVNMLFERGAEVIYSDIAETHVSGHACQEELKLVLSLIKPRYFMPVHGEFRHLKAHANLGEEMGIKKEKIFLLENGDCLELTGRRARQLQGVVQSGGVMVDGLGVGDVGNIVLRDRKLLSESGLIVIVASIDGATHEVVSGPDIISRGFVYVRENEDLIVQAQKVAVKSGITISIPYISSSGNDIPQSITIISFPYSRAVMFFPISRIPPKGTTFNVFLSFFVF